MSQREDRPPDEPSPTSGWYPVGDVTEALLAQILQAQAEPPQEEEPTFVGEPAWDGLRPTAPSSPPAEP